MLNICLQITSENAGLTVFLIALISVLAVLIIKFALYKYKWSLKRIDKMKGADFEDFMKSVYELLGYRVQKTKKSGDQGIDLIIKKHFKSTGIQLKRYSGTVGNSAVQEAVAGKRFYKLDRICVLTNTYFTRSAIELAKANKVELLNREDLALLIKKAKKKQRGGNKMKKLLALLLCLITCISLAGCSLLSGEHDKHRYRKRWESNAAMHWHECKYSDCKQKGNIELHVYENGKCTVCGYKEQTISEHK